VALSATSADGIEKDIPDPVGSDFTTGARLDVNFKVLAIS